jgi:hypothetical protein
MHHQGYQQLGYILRTLEIMVANSKSIIYMPLLIYLDN